METKTIPSNGLPVDKTGERNPKSPIRYPGGKYRAVKKILPFLPQKPGILVSPFVGGGSVELAAANIGWQVHAYDAFQPLVCFWQVLLTNREELAEEVSRYYPLPRDEFYRLQRMHFSEPLQEAARFFILNRASFNGSTMSGGMSPGHDRFTKSCIQRLREFRAGELWVEKLDFAESILQHPDAFMYLDPPYWSATRLYGKQGSMHEDFDHEGLRDLLATREQWLMSYDDCPTIREMYAGYRIIQLEWKYGMATDKQSRELLILGSGVAV